MADGATGTPTSLGIPKYNTGVDAPSGRGFNSAMESIDALLVSAVRSVDTKNADEVPVWNGSAWVFQKVDRNQLAGSSFPTLIVGGSGQSIPTTSQTVVTHTSIATNTGVAGEYSVNGTTGRVTINVAGIYLLQGTLAWSTTGYEMVALIMTDGAERERQVQPNSGVASRNNIFSIAALAAGSVVGLDAFQASGSSRTLNSRFAVMRFPA